MHDDRCEADWNDGQCACADRRENASLPWHTEPERGSLIRRITARLAS
jgi:hypothetical protein